MAENTIAFTLTKGKKKSKENMGTSNKGKVYTMLNKTACVQLLLS